MLLLRFLYFILFLGVILFDFIIGIRSIVKKKRKLLIIYAITAVIAITGLLLGTVEGVVVRPRFIENTIDKATVKMLSNYKEGIYDFSVNGYKGNFYVHQEGIGEKYKEEYANHLKECIDEKSVLGRNGDTIYYFQSITLTRNDEYFGLPQGSRGMITAINDEGTITINYIYTEGNTVSNILSIFIEPLIPLELFYREKIDIMKIADSDAVKVERIL